MIKRFLFIFLSVFFILSGAGAQNLQRFGNFAQGNNNRGKGDSLNLPHKRVEEKITIHYHYLNSVTPYSIDSSINDFTRYIPLKAADIYLGNLGLAEKSLVYAPPLKPGFDPGFHAFDDYRFMLDSTRFYSTTKPYTVLSYLIGAKQEQMIDVFHTQNPRENFNFGFHYRKINSPGFFRNENTNDDSYNIFAHYHTRNKRYNAFMSFIANKLNAGESGGIVYDSLLSNPDFSDRRLIGTHLGGSGASITGFFSAPLATKSGIKESGILLRQSYDWGTGDTVKVNDTTSRYEFYPVFRIEHTLQLLKTAANFSDTIPDTAYYFQNYGLIAPGLFALRAEQDWSDLSNDLSAVQFPVKTNQGHFIRAGATFENARGNFLYNSIAFSNIFGHFEYHNRTRNGKWDLDAYGELYLAGNNFGDYRANASLSRYISDEIGDIRLGFVNANQTPAFVYRFFQANRFVADNPDLKKQNTLLLQFNAAGKKAKYNLSVNYYLLTNYTYFSNYYASDQYATTFNLLQVLLSKQFSLGHLSWYLDLAYQQTDGAAPLHVPHLWTRDRLAYENILFKNLVLSTGVELKYHTAYYADDYSPVLQQFVSQRQVQLSNVVPDAAVFVHFRIKSFSAFCRAENLNTFLSPNIMEVPHYPYPGFAIRVGLKWAYIN